MSLAKNAQRYATEAHAATAHTYDGHPYAFHLNMVAAAAAQFTVDLEPEVRELVLAAAWCHDLIEDARETYNDVKKVVGEEVAEVVYALTNEKGRTRSERANDRYYTGIKETPYATLVKVCDRIANVRHSLSQQSRMYAIYQNEFQGFKAKLYVPGQYEAAWTELESLLFANL